VSDEQAQQQPADEEQVREVEREVEEAQREATEEDVREVEREVETLDA
jgi:hypothetical protein